MKIVKLAHKLLAIAAIEGDIEATCTGSLLQDGYVSGGHKGVDADVFETTVENLVVGHHEKIGKRVRLYL